MDTGNSHGLEAALPTDNREGQSDESRDLEEASPTDLALALDEAATAEVLNVQTFHDDGNSPTTILEENQKQTLALEEAARAEVLKVQTLLENDNTIHTDASVEVDVDDLCLDDLEMAQDKDYKKMHITFPSKGAKALSEIEDKAMAVLPVQAEHVRAEVRKMEKLFNNNNSTETSPRRRGTAPPGYPHPMGMLSSCGSVEDPTNLDTMVSLPALGRAQARRNPTSHPGAFAVDGPGFDDDDDGERTITVEASNQLEDITSQPLPNNADDDGLVEARPISEGQQHLSQATPMRESEELHNSNMIRDKRAFVVLGGMLMLVGIITTVVTALAVVNKSSLTDSSSIMTDNNETTMAPTPTPYILDLPGYTLDVLKNDIDGVTPQYQAYQWLTKDPNVESYSLDRLLQRFALACLYYSTNGDAWYKGAQTAMSNNNNDDDNNNNNSTGTSGNSNQRLLRRERRTAMRQIQGSPQGTIPGSSIEIARPKTPGDGPDPTGSGGPCGNDPPAGVPPGGGPPGGGPPGGGPPGGGPPPAGSCGQGRPPPRPPVGGEAPGRGSAWLSYFDDECDWFTNNPPGPSTCDEDGMYIRLNLESNGLQSSNLPNELALLSGMKLLKLGGNNNLQGTLSSFLFEAWHQINVLTFEGSSLKGSIPSSIRLSNNSLVTLVLQNNQMTGLVPDSLFSLSRLDTLKLSQNKFSGTLPGDVLSGLGSLRVFVVEWNNFGGSIPTEIQAMTSLSIFSTHGNSFSGTIPSEVGLLTNLFHLTLGDALEGTIPSDLGLLTLDGFSVRHNEGISGTIPEELGDRFIPHVYVDGTNLTGTIPDQWCNASILAIDCAQLCGCDCPSCGMEDLGNKTAR